MNQETKIFKSEPNLRKSLKNFSRYDQFLNVAYSIKKHGKVDKSQKKCINEIGEEIPVCKNVLSKIERVSSTDKDLKIEIIDLIKQTEKMYNSMGELSKCVQSPRRKKSEMKKKASETIKILKRAEKKSRELKIRMSKNNESNLEKINKWTTLIEKDSSKGMTSAEISKFLYPEANIIKEVDSDEDLCISPCSKSLKRASVGYAY